MLGDGETYRDIWGPRFFEPSIFFDKSRRNFHHNFNVNIMYDMHIVFSGPSNYGAIRSQIQLMTYCHIELNFSRTTGSLLWLVICEWQIDNNCFLFKFQGCTFGAILFVLFFSKYGPSMGLPFTLFIDGSLNNRWNQIICTSMFLQSMEEKRERNYSINGWNHN